MNRRAFIAGLGGAVAWPMLVSAQHTKSDDRVRRIGFLLGATDEFDPESQTRIAAFRQGIHALGWRSTFDLVAAT
jgi:putative ABC transport system substrate-binding protein